MAVTRPGDLTLIDTTRPFSFEFGQDFSQLTLHIPEQLLEGHLDRPTRPRPGSAPSTASVLPSGTRSPRSTQASSPRTRRPGSPTTPAGCSRSRLTSPSRPGRSASGTAGCSPRPWTTSTSTCGTPTCPPPAPRSASASRCACCTSCSPGANSATPRRSAVAGPSPGQARPRRPGPGGPADHRHRRRQRFRGRDTLPPRLPPGLRLHPRPATPPRIGP